MNIKSSEILSHFENANPEDRAYVAFHQYRYIHMLENLRKMLAMYDCGKTIRLLDIGPAYQTKLIRKYFPQISVDTLGIQSEFNNLREGEKHYYQDLNYSNEQWEVEKNRYHIILFCEVIEHLYTMPELCLKKLFESLVYKGRILIQTPNAAAIHKRVKLLLGFNPYLLLDNTKMGHFREYTEAELTRIARSAGLEVESIEMKNYFNNKSSFLNRAYVQLEAFMPGSFRDGISLIAIKQQSA